MRAINPATEQVVAEYADHDAAHVERTLRAAGRAFADWRRTPLGERCARLAAAGEVLRARADELARLMTVEMGKPVTAARAEVEKCAAACEHFADRAGEYLAPRAIATDATESWVRYDPLGTVLAIMPWNFPFWQVFRFAAPALAAGNVAVLKHAPNVPGCALAIEEVFRVAGFPAGVFASLLIDNEAAERLIAHPAVRAVTLTGSTRAGEAVGAAAARVVKKVVLELGGSDAFIVLPPVDVGRVARAAAAARCINAGQSCIAAKRFIVHAGVAREFTEAFVAAMAAQVVGDPAEEATEVGPLARLDLLENLEREVRETVAAGARVLTGGRRPRSPGCYYAPTVLGDVVPGMAAFDEETFGPVAAVTVAADAGEAVRLANASAYGLGASIWTDDVGLARSLVPEVEAGSVFVNGPVKSDPRLPFGGTKQSGLGRELAAEGIREFTNVKTVWVR